MVENGGKTKKQNKKQTKNQEPREICCSKVILALKFFTIYELQFIFCSKYAHAGQQLPIIVFVQ